MSRKLKIALIGYGKMGHEIENLAQSQGHAIEVIIDNEEDWAAKAAQLKETDVAIEFTTPGTAVANYERCFQLGLPVVTGTTGWESLVKVEEMCHKYNGAFFYASNFSPGVNIFFEINRRLAQLLAGIEDYAPRISETHHLQKLDAPSGTAVSLANDITAINPRLKKWVLADHSPEPEDLPVEAHRIENVTGTHIVSYHGTDDSIEIKHTAHRRRGFARGALMAAVWITGKKGIFTMKDMLKI